MSDIVFLREFSPEASATELTYINLLTGDGHTVVNIFRDDFDEAYDLSSNADLVWISNETGNARLDNSQVRLTTKSVVHQYGKNMGDSGLGFTNSSSATTTITQAVIEAGGHAMNAGIPLGQATLFDPIADARRLTTIGGFAAGFVPTITDIASPGFIYSGYIPAGGLLSDGVTLSPNLRCLVIGSVGTPATSFNSNGVSLLLATVSFAAGDDAAPKLEGTLTPWDTQVPAANLTGVKYSVRSDLQTSDNQVLSGTTTTNASGQFTIEDAALSALTTYYVTFENATGTVFATHKITTD